MERRTHCNQTGDSDRRGGQCARDAKSAGWCIAMTRHVLRVTWYRFRATLGQQRAGYAALVLLVGLLGGLSMGAVAAARRTGSSFAAFRASTKPSDLTVGLLDPRGYD